MSDTPPSFSPPQPALSGLQRFFGAGRRSARQCLWGLFELCAWLWIGFAILFLILRHFLMPQVAAHRADIEGFLQQRLQTSISLGAIEAHWQGLRPALTISELRILDATKQQTLLHLPEVRGVLSWRSLWHWQPELWSLRIRQADLVLKRDASGQLSIAGIPIPASQDDSKSADVLLAQREIRIENSQLHWQDDLHKTPIISLKNLQLQLNNRSDNHRISLAAGSPQIPTQGFISLEADVRGKSLYALQNWHGQLRAKVPQTNFTAWQSWLNYYAKSPVQLTQGSGSIDATLNFEGPQTASLHSSLQIQNLHSRLAPDLPPLQLRTLNGRFNSSWRDGAWSFESERLQLTTQEGMQFRPRHLSLRRKPAQGTQNASGELLAEDIELAVLSQLTHPIPLPAKMRADLNALAPRGQVKRLAAQWQDPDPKQDIPTRFQIDTEFTGLAWQKQLDSSLEHPGLPGLSGLSGHISGNQDSGRIQLSLAHSQLDWPKLFVQTDSPNPPPLPLDKMQLQADWQRLPAKQGPAPVRLNFQKITLNSPHIRQAELHGHWQQNGKPGGYLQLQGSIQSAPASAIWRYLPHPIHQGTRDWLHNGLRQGEAQNVQVKVIGDLDHFPPRTPQNHAFQITAKLKQVDLSFAPTWPTLDDLDGRFLLEDNHLHIEADSGHYRNVALKNVRVDHPDLSKSHDIPLKISGQANGPGTEMLDYVRASPVAKYLGSFLQKLATTGDNQLDLVIDVPLQHAVDTTVLGTVSLDNNDVQLDPGLPLLKNLQGSLQFTEHGLGPTQAKGRFLDGDFTAEGNTEAQDTVFRAKGKLPATGLRQLFDYPLWQYLSGSAEAQAEIRINKQGAQIHAISPLVGLAVSLPAPLNKSAETARNFDLKWLLDTSRGEQQREHWQLQLEQTLLAQWQSDCAPRCQFARGLIQFGPSLSSALTSPLPKQGVSFKAEYPSLHLEPLMPVIRQFVAAHSKKAPEGSNTPNDAPSDPFNSLHLFVDSLQLAGHRFAKQHLHLTPAKAGLHIRLDGPQASGDADWLHANGSNPAQLTAKLQHLSLQPLNDSNANDPSKDNEPDDRPTLLADIENFQYRKIVLGKLHLNVIPTAQQGWHIKTADIENSDGTLHAEGRSQGNNTQLQLKLAADNLGGLFNRLGFADALRKGRADVDGTLGWDGPLTSFRLADLNGQLKLDARDGQFNKLQPGAARLLGILSLQSLPRRLTLDFRDLFSDGFAFDSITSDLIIKRGQLQLEPLTLVGPAARVVMRGNTNLATETHQLDLNVQPALSETVAIGLGAVTLNPIIGLGTWAAQKIFRNPLEKLFSIDYSIRGSWSDPKIEKVRTETRPSQPSTPLTPSAPTPVTPTTPITLATPKNSP